jgi:hypothetical protein
MSKEFLENSYRGKKQKKEINGYIRDDKLSGQRAQVYHNPETNKTIVTHRGTASSKDIINDLAVGTGFGRHTNRFKHAKKIQTQAENKYGKENITTEGHSLGGFLSENVTKGRRTTVNKAVALTDRFKKIDKNQHDIRNSLDPVSAIGLFQSGGKRSSVRNTINPWKAHQLKYTIV